MFVNIPLSVSMIVMAKLMIVTLCGAKLLPSVQILQVLGITSLVRPLHSLNINVLKPQGCSDLIFRIIVIKKMVAVSLTIAEAFQGILAIVRAQVVASSFYLLINAYYSKVFLGFGVLRQIVDRIPSLVSGLVMGLVMTDVISGFFGSNAIQLQFGITSGFAAKGSSG